MAAAAGGTIELIEPDKTGWLTPPEDAKALAKIITTCRNQPDKATAIAQQAHSYAAKRFSLTTTNLQIEHLLEPLL